MKQLAQCVSSESTFGIFLCGKQCTLSVCVRNSKQVQLTFKSSTVENTVFIIKINKLHGGPAQTLGLYWFWILIVNTKLILEFYQIAFQCMPRPQIQRTRGLEFPVGSSGRRKSLRQFLPNRLLHNRVHQWQFTKSICSSSVSPPLHLCENIGLQGLTSDRVHQGWVHFATQHATRFFNPAILQSNYRDWSHELTQTWQQWMLLNRQVLPIQSKALPRIDVEFLLRATYFYCNVRSSFKTLS